MTNVLPQGRFPAVLAVSLLPLIMSAVLRTLESPGKKWWVTGLIATAVSVAFHPMVFYIAALGLAAIAAAYAVSTKTSLNRIILVGSMIVLDVFVAWLALPTDLSSLSFGNDAASTLVNDAGPGVRATTGGDAEIVPFSIRWNSFDVGIRSFNENYAGLGMVLAGLVALVFAWRKKVALFAVAAIFLYLLATGTMTPFWNMIPLASALEPRRFLFPAYLAVGLVIASGVSVLVAQMRGNPGLRVWFQSILALVAIAALLAFDAIPMAGRIAPEEREQENNWVDLFESASNGGRAFWNTATDFAPYYFIGRKAGVETVGRLNDIDLAVRQGFPENAFQQLALLDVRAVLSDRTLFGDLIDRLIDQGYSGDFRVETQVVLTSGKPSSRVMVPSRKVGLLGTAALSHWSRIIPNSVPLTSLSTVPIEFLDSLDAIVLSAYSVENESVEETRLTDYVERGGFVILEEPNRSGDDLFGVEAVQRVVPEPPTIEAEFGSFETLPFEIEEGRFVGTFYDGAGETMFVGADALGNVVPIIQR